MRKSRSGIIVSFLLLLIFMLSGCIQYVSNSFILAILNNDLTAAEDELKNDVNPNSLYSYYAGDSKFVMLQPLEEACYLKNLEAIKLLCAYGADVSKTFVSGAQPLHLACLAEDLRWVPYPNKVDMESQSEVINYLLQNGADPNALIVARVADTSRTTPLMYLLAKPGLNEESLFEIVVNLINSGAKSTPFACLFLAVRANYFSIADYLLSLGDDINATSELKGEPILTAILSYSSIDEDYRENYLKGAKYLLDKGADFYSKDTFGKTAYDYAIELQLTDVIAYMDELADQL